MTNILLNTSPVEAQYMFDSIIRVEERAIADLIGLCGFYWAVLSECNEIRHLLTIVGKVRK